MKLLTSKKAQQENYLAVVIFLLGFGLITMFATLIYQNLLAGLVTAGVGAEAIAVGNTFLGVLQFYDLIMVFLLVALLIGVGITSFKLNTAPIFFVVTLFMGAITAAVSYFFNYIFFQIVSHTAFTTVVALFPKTILICTNLHWVALVAIIIGSITLYAKKEQGAFVGE